MRELTRSRFGQIDTRRVACSPAGSDPNNVIVVSNRGRGEPRWDRSLAKSSNAVCDVIVHTAGEKMSAVIR